MNHKKLLSAACALALISAPFMSGCGGEYTSKSYDYYSVMGSQAKLVLTAQFDSKTEQKAQELADECYEVLEGVSASLSASYEGSSVYNFNEAAAGETVQIDETCYTVLSTAIELYQLTEGYFNPAIYYSVDLYGFAARSSSETMPYDRDSLLTLPDEEYISAFKTLAEGFADITLISDNGSYYAVKPLTTVTVDGESYSLKIDLGGLGKGYAVDIIDELISSYGFTYGYISFGSSSIAVKESRDGEDNCWNTGFTDPRGIGGSHYATAQLKNCRLSTSGDYQQYYEVDGVRYCHIIDPTTGSPVQTGIMTATVAGGTAAEDDALTTALMAMGLERAVSFINANLKDKFVLLTYENGGSYYIITNRPDEIQIVSEAYSIMNTVDGEGNIVLN